MKNYDPEEYLNKENSLLVIFISTYEDGCPPEDAKWFYQWLMDAKDDFRLDKDHLKHLKFAVVGFGSSYYEDNFNIVAKNIDAAIESLSGNKLLPVGICDENVINSANGGLDYDYDAWSQRFWRALNRPIVANGKSDDSICCKNDNGQSTKSDSCCKSKNSGDTSIKEPVEYQSSDDEEDEEAEEAGGGSGGELVDVEDLGMMMKKRKEIIANTSPREMLTPTLRASLEKQGYKLIGSHSGVKMCRWTKVGF